MHVIAKGIVVAFGLGALASSLFAHGGTYRGPSDTVPPGGSGGGPTTGPGGSGPGPSGPNSGSPGGPMGLGGPSGPNSGGPGGNGPSTGPRGVGLPDLSIWQYWWEYNKAPYLDLKAAVFKGGLTTGAQDEPFGRVSGGASLRPTDSQIRSKAVPALLKALEEETNNDIVTGALIALAKIGGDPSFLDSFQKHLPSANQEISETAALAIGILGMAQGRGALEQLAADNEAGRKLVGGKEVPYRTRAFAVYGLGLIGHAVADENVRAACAVAVRELLANDKSSYKDLRVACILALGLIPDEGALSVEQLRNLLRDTKVDKIVRAHCPRALARLVENSHPLKASVVQDLIALLSERKEKDFVRQSLVYALGLLVHPGDDEHETAVKAIEAVALESVDEQERHFALMALGRMGGAEAQDFLVRQLHKPRSSGMRPWAAISLGALGHAAAKANNEPSTGIVRALQSRFSEERNPSHIAAYAIALGMLRDATSRELLTAALENNKDEEIRGYLCLALGMIGSRDSVEPIRKLVKDAKNKPQLLYQGITALGLLGDKAMLPELLDMLRGARTLAVRSAVVSSLGYIGDQRSVDPLVENLASKKLQPIERGFSAAALGLICDKEMLPWNSKISVDLNYRAAVTTLADKAGAAGIVDIL